MRNLPELPDSYFERFKNKKVKILPFDPKTKIIAAIYIYKLKKLLKDYDVEFRHRGSTFFGICGKGEIEIGVYPKARDWNSVLAKLKKLFGKVDNLEENYARFNDLSEGIEIEVIVQKGLEAQVDKALHKYLISHPDLLKEYENTKIKYSSSKKEYMIQKDKFFRKVIKELTDPGSV